MLRSAFVAGALCGCLAVAGRPEPRPISDAPVRDTGQPSTCPRWAQPEPMLTSDGRPVYVESPSAVRLTSGVALFGYPTFVWATPEAPWHTDSARQTPVAIEALFAGEQRVTPIPPPQLLQTNRPSDVIATTDGRGGAYAFWTNVPNNTATPAPTATSVHGARFGSDGWSTPEVVLKSDIIRWNRVSAAAVSYRGTIHVVVSGSRAGGDGTGGGIAHVRRESGQWVTSWINTGSLPPAYVAVLAEEGQPWVVAFIGAVATKSLTVNNGGYVVVSHDHGRTWSDVVLVRDFGADIGQRVQLLSTPDRSIHMFWGVRGAGATGTTRVEHIASRDGVAWHRAPDFEASARAGFQSGVTARGTLFLVYRQPDSLQVRASEWDGKAWRTPYALGEGGAATEPRPIELGPDSLYLIWARARPSAQTSNEPSGRAPMSWWAHHVSECGPGK